MTSKDSAGSSMKTKAIHELRELVFIFVFLAFFFCALTTYSMLLLHAFQIKSSSYGFALINALVIAKVILIGDYAKVGRGLDSKPLIYSSMYNALIYTLLVFGFHVVEEAIKRLIHGVAILSLPDEMHFEELLARSIVVFCVFIPFFAFRELRRVLGEDRFHALFFLSGEAGRLHESS
jgi:hypothetical protein